MNVQIAPLNITNEIEPVFTPTNLPEKAGGSEIHTQNTPCYFICLCVIITGKDIIHEKEREKSMGTPRRINIAIDETLHRELRIAAAVNDTTIKKYVAEAICDKLKREKVERNKKYEPNE